MWTSFVGAERKGGEGGDGNSETSGDEAFPDTFADTECNHNTLHKGVFRDNRRCYLGPAPEVNALLHVEAYSARWPLIPLEELHGSSVQHPKHPEMRWLLHTKRVPVCKAEVPAPEASDHDHGDGVAEHDCKPDGVLPRSAGIGDASEDVWLCKDCVLALCVANPRMPPLALAKDLFSGHVHSLYLHLRPAMRAALSPGRAVQRIFALRARGGDEDTAQKGFSGNIRPLRTTVVACVDLYVRQSSLGEIEKS